MRLKFLSIAGLFFIPILFVACAEEKQDQVQAESNPMAIRLVLPAGEDPEEFWDGVSGRDFLWQAKNSSFSMRLPLTGGGRGVDFSTGGELRFEGRSAAGALLVVGVSEVAPWDPSAVKEKLILISLHRR